MHLSPQHTNPNASDSTDAERQNSTVNAKSQQPSDPSAIISPSASVSSFAGADVSDKRRGSVTGVPTNALKDRSDSNSVISFDPSQHPTSHTGNREVPFDYSGVYLEDTSISGHFAAMDEERCACALFI